MRRMGPAVLLSACLAAGTGGILTVAQEKGAARAASPSPTEQRTAQEASKPQSTWARQSAYSLKVNTRLVTVDVVATDSHGQPVRDLRSSDFKIFQDRNVREDIAEFAFLGNSAANMALAASRPPLPAGVYSNMPAPIQFPHPPTILLVDGINTTTANQLQVRRNLLRMLKTLPPDMPIAVFLLGSSLDMLQNFTTDTALLRKAVDQAMTANIQVTNPQFDPAVLNAMSQLESAAQVTPSVSDMVAFLQQFEVEEYTESMRIRMLQTTRALRSIANFMGGYPGRKNLVWLSEAFPLFMGPGAGTDYSEDVQSAAKALGDAQIAVYPVDAKGLATWQSFAAERYVPSVPVQVQSPEAPGSLLPGTGADTQLEQKIWNASAATMSTVAESTGGKACQETNDLAGCVETAMKDGSAYYELGYYPQGIPWDGSFHSITVKTSRPNVHLDYRRGFYAADAESLMKEGRVRTRLKDSCSDPLPATEIYLTAKPLPSDDATKLKFLLTVSANDLLLPHTGNSWSLDILVAACMYGAKGDSGHYFEQEDSQSVSDADYRTWESEGIPDKLGLTLAPGAGKVRIVVVDKHSGLSGAVDVPLSPAPAQTEVATAGGKAGASRATAENPSQLVDVGTEIEPAPPIPYFGKPYFLRFRTQTGQTGTIDWSKGTVSYEGDLPVAYTASFFFQSFYAQTFHCQAGNLAPNVADSKTVPNLEFKFVDATGKTGLVDLRGGDPQFSGDLPFDAKARALFQAELPLCHCRSK
jgi:VWFA-related protein